MADEAVGELLPELAAQVLEDMGRTSVEEQPPLGDVPLPVEQLPVVLPQDGRLLPVRALQVSC